MGAVLESLASSPGPDPRPARGVLDRPSGSSDVEDSSV